MDGAFNIDGAGSVRYIENKLVQTYYILTLVVIFDRLFLNYFDFVTHKFSCSPRALILYFISSYRIPLSLLPKNLKSPYRSGGPKELQHL
jgi:hypothetical protein